MNFSYSCAIKQRKQVVFPSSTLIAIEAGSLVDLNGWKHSCEFEKLPRTCPVKDVEWQLSQCSVIRSSLLQVMDMAMEMTNHTDQSVM